MMGAHDVPSLLDAAREWRAPVQNLFAADRDGRIALAAIGAVPIRRGGDGTLPVPGWDDRYGWVGAIPAETLPRALDPPGGFLMNANNRLVTDDTGVFLTADWDAPYRGLRLHGGLSEASDQDIASAAAWQTDTISVFAQAVLAASAGWIPTDTEARQALDALRAWPGAMRRDRFEPLIFNAWMRALRRDALRHLFGDDAQTLPAAGREAPALVLAIAANDPWPCSRYACRAAMERTLSEALSALRLRFGNRMEAWRWGDAHRATFENPVWRSVPLLGRWLGFATEADGDNFTVNRATPRGADLDAFPVVHGA
jgi:penicillin amidase